MKKNLNILIIVSFHPFFGARKKANEDMKANSIVGFWKGKESALQDWSWLLGTDNTMRLYHGVVTANAAGKYEGTYSNTDSTFTLS